jgi:hypothetical protein
MIIEPLRIVGRERGGPTGEGNGPVLPAARERAASQAHRKGEILALSPAQEASRTLHVAAGGPTSTVLEPRRGVGTIHQAKNTIHDPHRTRSSLGQRVGMLVTYRPVDDPALRRYPIVCLSSPSLRHNHPPHRIFAPLPCLVLIARPGSAIVLHPA